MPWVTGRRAAFVTMACGLLGLTRQPALAAEASKPDLRGMTWESIRQLPDFGRGMRTPGRPPIATVPAVNFQQAATIGGSATG